MKTKHTALDLCSVSPIYATCNQDGNGILGFTIHNSDGSFNNVLRDFSPDTRDLVMAEITREREKQLNHTKND